MCSTRVLVVTVLSTLVNVIWSAEVLSFPPGFKFGVGSAAYQIEGAWNVSDKGESTQDYYIHKYPGKIVDNSSGDVACDSYHLWERDIQMIKDIGANFYRFSISWTRLLPTGFPNYISEDGKKYYNNLIDGLLEKGIEPIVTLYHWDLPMMFQNYGGWVNPLIADWFADYARVVFSLYADRVKIWLTINEPLMICDLTYNMGSTPPGYLDPDISPYLCNKNVLLAHAKAWRIYDEEFKPKYHGKVAIVNALNWYEPLTKDDEELANLVIENVVGRYSHPIYSRNGGWPPAIEKIMADISKEKGLLRSKLPAFTKEEIELLKGTYDFYALNHYISNILRKALPGEKLLPWPMDCPDVGAKLVKSKDWPVAEGFDWFRVYPQGLRKHLVWLKKTYGDMETMIMENGYPTKLGLNDEKRVNYHRDILEQIILAVKEDGVNVTKYAAWSLMDSFEWATGYQIKFGLYEVDFSSKNRTRTARDSAKFYAKVIENHALPKGKVWPL